jgi:hypothetical protein
MGGTSARARCPPAGAFVVEVSGAAAHGAGGEQAGAYQA